MVTQFVLSIMLMTSLLTKAQAREINPAEEGKLIEENVYRQAYLNESYFNRLPISVECSENYQVDNYKKSELIHVTEQRLNFLLDIKSNKSIYSLPKEPVYYASFLLKLMIQNLGDVDLIEKRIKAHNQIEDLNDEEFIEFKELKANGFKALYQTMRTIIDKEVLKLRKDISQQEKILNLKNAALKAFLKTRSLVPETLVGLNETEKENLRREQSGFEITRCQVIKMQKRLESLTAKKL